MSRAPLKAQLDNELAILKQKGTLKKLLSIESPMGAWVEMEGRGKVLVLSSNNYLGLANHPKVVAAGKQALDDYGAGTASVRFICGTFSAHDALESAIAKLHGTEASISYVSCWAANTGLIPSIAGEGDVIIADALNHASLIDGCRMAKAKRMVYPHADMAALEAALKEAGSARRVLVITDGVFSMEGSIAPLPNIVELCEKYNATLVVDDSHGVGVMGKRGFGTAEYFGLEDRVDIYTGTLGKALGGAAGGYVAGPKALCEYLHQVSRPQLFSNALPATVAASALAAIEVLMGEPDRVAKLHANTRLLRELLVKEGFKPLEGPSAIVPIIVGDTAFAIKMSQELLEEGIFVTGFGFPVVPEGTARLRVQCSAALSEEDISFAVQRFAKVGKRLGVI